MNVSITIINNLFLNGTWPYWGGIVETKNMTWNKNGLLVNENSSQQFFYHYFFLISRLVLCKLYTILNGIENNWCSILHIGTFYSEMVEESSGSVVMVGGFSDDPDTDDIWRLAVAKSEWLELPQKLASQRGLHVAFLVPDHYTECTGSSK